MEFHIFLSTTVVAIICVTVLLQILKKKRGKKTEPPEPKGAWPIIGHLHLLGGSQPPHKVLSHMADIYGPIFTLNLGVHQALVVSNGDIAKECFTTNDKVFGSRPKSVAVELMGYNYAMFGLGPYGDYWRHMRKIITLEMLSQRRVEMVGHVRVSELRAATKVLYDGWVNKRDQSNMVKVEMKEWFESLVLNIVVRIIWGKRFAVDDEEGVRFRGVTRRFIELLGAFVVSDFVPYLRGLDIGGYEKEMKMVGKEMDDMFEGWLEEHKRCGKQDEEVFIDVLSSTLEGSSFIGQNHDNDTIIKASCLTLLTAALDTTSVTLTWALSLILNNPKTLKIAQDEIDEHVGRERLVEQADIKKLVYIEAIIKETLRLYPAAPLSVPQESMVDCIVSGYSICKGTRLLVNLWKMHRDPNIWSNPNDFQPERFLTRQKDIDVKGNHFELLPFGSGRRMCPGVSFALEVLHVTLASFIQQFILRKPSNEPIDMSESSGLTTTKALPLEVLLAPRLSPNMYPIGA